MFLFLYRRLRPRELCPLPQIDADLCWLSEAAA
jgi:hypothetical protein